MTAQRLTALAIVAFLTTATARAGQQSDTSASAAAVPADGVTLPFDFDGAPSPVPPATVSRDAAGRVTIRAVRLTMPLRLDGKLDEPVYETIPPVSDFIQTEPNDGEPATERTELWITFDKDHVYISLRCYESEPERVVANEMRRDSNTMWQGNDIVSIMLDTFYDKRNGYEFTMNSIGGRSDGQFTNERNYSGDWNPVWQVAAGRFARGWTVEAAIPFKSLRYRPGRAQIWGFNAFRTNRWKNELSFVSHVPPGRGQGGLTQPSSAATIVGLEAPAGAKNLEFKPYGTSSVTSDRKNAVDNKLTGDLGLDVKYGITPGLTADFTYNTDFAQVEADEQQVNLTRFNLQFPEKRDFFLENRGTFTFGGSGGGGGGGNFQGGGGDNTPQLFYSRRIGLVQTATDPILVPIIAGARTSGRVGRFRLGLLDIGSNDDARSGTAATNFSVLRVSRDILRRSSIGAMFTRRSVSLRGPDANQAYGVDATLGFFQNLTINSYWARTSTGGLAGDDVSYRGQLDYNGDRYGLQLERLAVGANFNPEVGFVRRYDMRRTFAQGRFSPRPKSIASVRRFIYQAEAEHIANGAGVVETRRAEGEFQIEMQSADRYEIRYERTFDYLPKSFEISPGVIIPAGGYTFGNVRGVVQIAQQRKLSAQIRFESGSFYGGDRSAIEIVRGRIAVSPRLSLEPTYTANWVTVLAGVFTTHLFGSRVTYTMTPLMFVSALTQYNSSAKALSTNVRLRWEYQPGSELFVVYNEQRDALVGSSTELSSRAIVVKVTRLFRL